MTLDDIGLYSEGAEEPKQHKPLHRQARCVCSLVRRYLPRLKNENAWKINVYVREDAPKQVVSTNGGIVSVRLVRDVFEFYALSEQEKKWYVYEALLEGATIASSHLGWPTDEIVEAFTRARQDDLINEWKFQPKWSPTRKLRAYVRCVHEIESFRAWMRVEDRDGSLVAEQHLFDEIPDEFCFFPRLGKVRWIDRTSVRLSDRAGQPVADDLRVKPAPM